MKGVEWWAIRDNRSSGEAGRICVQSKADRTWVCESTDDVVTTFNLNCGSQPITIASVRAYHHLSSLTHREAINRRA